MIELGRDLCSDLAISSRREWLVANGIGGYAGGTVSGVPTRRYHGLLVAAWNPPLGRTLLVPKLEEWAEYCGRLFPMGANRWASGAVEPRGFRLRGPGGKDPAGVRAVLPGGPRPLPGRPRRAGG